MKKKKQLKKKRKPKLKGWSLFYDNIWSHGPGVLHQHSGRWWVGKKRLREIGNFFLKAAEYFE